MNKNALRPSSFPLPKRKFNVKNKIKEIYSKLFVHLEDEEKKKKVSFNELIGENKEEKIISFLPLLHLENQKKIWLEQETHFDEIYIWLKDVFLKHNPNPLIELKEEIEEEIKELDEEQKQRLGKINKEFSNPLGNGI